jgi:WD40 repeat protein
VNAISFSPDGKTIASASDDRKAKLWHQDGKLLHTISGHSAGVNAVSFSPDGKIIASASEDTKVFLWHLDHVLNVNQLLMYGCDWVRDYLKTNPDISQSVSGTTQQEARHLCDK